MEATGLTSPKTLSEETGVSIHVAGRIIRGAGLVPENRNVTSARKAREEGGTCTVDGCGKALKSGGLCAMHLGRTHRHGATGPAGTTRQRATPSEEAQVVALAREHDTIRGLAQAVGLKEGLVGNILKRAGARTRAWRPAPCTVAGCGKPQSKGKDDGLCAKHRYNAKLRARTEEAGTRRAVTKARARQLAPYVGSPKTAGAIGEETGLPERQVRHHLGRLGHASVGRTEQNALRRRALMPRIVALAEAGWSNRAIGREVGISHETVRGWLLVRAGKKDMEELRTRPKAAEGTRAGHASGGRQETNGQQDPQGPEEGDEGQGRAHGPQGRTGR